MSKIKKQLIQRVETLSNLLLDSNDESIKSSVDSFKDEIKEDITYNVTVLGEFSSGKSSMINTVFLGGDILPTKATPTTAILTTIKYGEEKKVKLYYKDGTFKEFTDNLEKILIDNVSTDSTGNNPSNVIEAEFFWPSEILEEGVVIVDTPGLNDPNKAREEITYKYLDKTDSIIYLSNSTAPWSRSVKEFVEENIFTKERAEKLFILLNYWDNVPKNERDEVYNYVQQGLKNSIDTVSKREEVEKIDTPILMPISAKTEEGIKEFREELWSFLKTIKGDEILEQKYAKFQNLKKKVSKIYLEKIDIQSKETEEINNEIETLQKEMDSFRKEVNAYKAKIKPTIEKYILEWQEDINDYYDNIETAIIDTCRSKIYNQKNEQDVKQLIQKSIHRVFSINEEKLNRITKKLNVKIEKFIIEQKAKLQLEYYFLTQNSKKMKKEAMDSFLAANPDYNRDNKISFLVVGGSVIGAALLATIAAPLAIVGFAGIAYGEIILKPELFRKNLDDLMDDIEIQITAITGQHKENIENLTQESVESILDSISNDITETYSEKEKLYKDALIHRNNNIDDKITQTLNKKLEEIDKI